MSNEYFHRKVWVKKQLAASDGLVLWRTLYQRLIAMFLHLAHTKTRVFMESKKITLECYKITKDFPKEEKFAMVQQIRRAALSVHLNIAEGCSRKSGSERKRFF